jgi:hypothetical protein
MGYRSTVAYTIRFVPTDMETDTIERCKATFFNFLLEAKSKEETALCFSSDESESFSINEDDLAIYFYASGVKWYEDYPDVKCHEALMDLSREWADDGDCSNPFIGGAFARVGESSEDNTEDCWGQGDYDWCYLTRDIVCDWKN